MKVNIGYRISLFFPPLPRCVNCNDEPEQGFSAEFGRGQVLVNFFPIQYVTKQLAVDRRGSR